MVVGFTEHLANDAGLLLGTIRLKNRKIISDSVCKLVYDILNRDFITL